MIRQWIRSYPIHVFICLGLALIVIVPFYQTSQFKFVSYGVSRYILGNMNIQAGFDQRTFLRAAIKNKPDYVLARDTKAVLPTGKNRIGEATDELNEVLRINLKYAEAISNLTPVPTLVE